jgi:small subunit ribosomal protein S18
MAKKQTTVRRRKIIVPKQCYFCSEQKDPTLADVSTLQRYITDRGKIIGRARNGLCARHQRALTSEIKYSRHLALMPFVVRD